MRIIQLFLRGHGEAVISDELVSLKIKDGFVQVKYKGESCPEVYTEYHNVNRVSQISIFNERGL